MGPIVIAGPVAPHTVAGIEAMLSRRLELLEHGLSVVAESIELNDVARISLFARDAAGAPVAVFAEEAGAAQRAGAVAWQAVRAHAYLTANTWLLQRLFLHRLPRAPAPLLRTMVVGMRFDAVALNALQALALPELSVFELHEWSVGGRHEWSARPVLARPAQDDDGFAAPSGLPAAQKDLAREFLSWLERLDADVAVEGDRFSRRLRARGHLLCTLAMEGADLSVTLADGRRTVLADREQAIVAMDQVMQAFAEVLPGTCRPAPPPADDTVDLAGLRRAVGEVRVTRDECDALQFSERAADEPRASPPPSSSNRSTSNKSSSNRSSTNRMSPPLVRAEESSS